MENIMKTGVLKTTGANYEDNFSFLTTEMDAFLDTLRAFGSERISRITKINEFSFGAMPDPIGMYEFCGKDDLLTEIAMDSHNSGTKVYMVLDGETFMLRDTACVSIYDRLDISGGALSKLTGKKLAEHLNDYAKVAEGEGFAIVNNGKLEAVMGKNYRLVPAEEVMEAAAEFFEDEGARFMNGYIRHQSAFSRWDMGERKIEIPINTGMEDIAFNQTVDVKTSDCGFSSIHVLPTMRARGDNYGLKYTMALSADHTGNTTIDTLRDNLALVSTQFDAAEKTIRRLADIYLEYPANVLLAMYKWLKIPAKYGAPIYEKKKTQWGDEGRSAYEVYSSLSEVLQLVLGDNYTLKDLAENQEKFGRALEFKFGNWDVPGVYAYTDKLIGQKGV